eukprot:TRINITY_DN3692_c0_g1_i1.p1 TRINITY_DN3692_c0_g1~~TRINITY_DN3692_c0_g1_i1.p1  ORF type:complete len:121 (+),score=20.91 TRINITY_DN3692_c0_g1_i1:113-475(+)
MSKKQSDSDGKTDVTQKFKRAVEFIQNLPQDGPYQPSAQEKLDFYGLFKQATDGPNTTKKPSMLNVVAKAKWEAWTKLGKIGKEDAMRRYVQKVLEVSKKAPGKESETLRKEIESVAAKL